MDGEHERKGLQDKFTLAEGELDVALSENLKLKSLAFETDTRVATY
jgi:chromosome segregation ATPase